MFDTINGFNFRRKIKFLKEIRKGIVFKTNFLARPIVLPVLRPESGKA